MKTHHARPARRLLNRRVIAVASLALVAPLAATQSTASATDAPRDLGRALAPASAQATSTVPTPPATVRQRLSSLEVEVSRLSTGDRVTFNLFDQLSVHGQVQSVDRVTLQQPAGEVITATGTLDNEGTFTAIAHGDARRILVTDAQGREYQVIADTDDSAARVVEQKTPEGPDDTGSHHVEGREPEPRTGLAPTEDALTAPPEAAQPEPTGTLARKAAAREPMVLWRSTRGNVDLAGWRSRLVAPTGDASAQIDEWVNYSSAAVAGRSSSQLVTEAAGQVAAANQVFANSGLSTRVALKRVTTSGAHRGYNLESEIDALIKLNDGYLDDALAQRRAGKLDHLTQIMASSAYDNCGIGTLAADDTVNGAPVSVVNTHCLPTGLTYTHELGHNLSAQHDRGASNTPSGTSYAFGYVDPQFRFRTVMSYVTSCPVPAQGEPCPRIAQFSSPTLTWNGLPTGNATTDNTRAVRGYTRALANVAPSRLYPGEIAVSGSPRANLGTLTAYSSYWLPYHTSISPSWYVNGRLVSRGPSFRPTPAMAGKKVQLVVTGSAPGYATTQARSAAFTILPAHIWYGRASFSGRGKVGNTLRVKPSRRGPAGMKASVVWKSGKKVVGKKKSYRLKARDRHKKVTATITYRAPGHTRGTSRVVWRKIV